MFINVDQTAPVSLFTPRDAFAKFLLLLLLLHLIYCLTPFPGTPRQSHISGRTGTSPCTSGVCGESLTRTTHRATHRGLTRRKRTHVSRGAMNPSGACGRSHVHVVPLFRSYRLVFFGASSDPQLSALPLKSNICAFSLSVLQPLLQAAAEERIQ